MSDADRHQTDAAFYRQAAATIVTRYAGLLIAVLGSVVIARALGASGRGGYAFVVAAVTTVYSVAHLSVEQALVALWDDEAGQTSLVGSGLVVALVSGVVGCVVLVALVVTGMASLPAGVGLWMVVAGGSVLPLWLASLYVNAVLTNDGRFGVINAVTLMTAVLQVVVLLGLAATGDLTVGAVVLVWAAATALPLLVQLPAVMRHPGIGRPRLAVMRKLVGLGLRYHLGMTALSLVLRVDVLLLASRVSVDQVGVYSLGVTIVELVLMATNSYAQVAVQVQIRGEPRATSGFTAHVARTSLVLAVVMLGVIWATGPFLVVRVFGQSFRGATSVIAMLSPGMAALALQRPLGIYVTRLNRPWPVTIGMVAALAANVLLNLVLIPVWGILGAAVASMLVYVCIAAWTATWFVRSGEVAARELRPRLSDLQQVITSVRGGR